MRRQADFTLDGQAVSAPEGELLVHAAAGRGVFIPALCHFDKLAPDGARASTPGTGGRFALTRSAAPAVKPSRAAASARGVPTARSRVSDGDSPEQARQAARLLQAYELLCWDTRADGR